jgi:hypothetical protein
MRVDKEILTFLWRWKLVSASAFAAKFFPHLTNSAANMRLEKLRKHQIIFPYHLNSTEAKVLWGLTSKGFQMAKDHLPDLSEDGFRSEHPLHDFLVTAVHLGEWLDQTPSNCDVFTEQELRRLSLDEYPSWVPKTPIHRPDGYWRVSLPEGTGTMALEVELKLKSRTKYGVVAKFYRDHPKIFRVIWVVATLPMAKAIRERLYKGSAENIGMHTFLLQKDFVQHGWQARIIFGYEQNKPFSYLLGYRDNKSLEKYFVFSILDTRKTPYAFKSYEDFSKESISPLGTHSIPTSVSTLEPISNLNSVAPLIESPPPTTKSRRKET